MHGSKLDLTWLQQMLGTLSAAEAHSAVPLLEKLERYLTNIIITIEFFK